LPKLGGVANPFRDRQSFAQGGLRLVPRTRYEGNLAPQSPTSSEILARHRARRDLQALIGERSSLVEIAPCQPQVSKAREDVHRISPFLPLADGRIVDHTMDTFEEVLGQVEISLRNKDISQVRLGVRCRFRIAALPCPRCAVAIELSPTFEVPELDVVPAQAIQQAMQPNLVADLRRECPAFFEEGARLRVVSHARPCDALEKECGQHRKHQIVLASDSQRFRLECRGLNELSTKVFQLARQGDRERIKEGVIAAPPHLTGLSELLVGSVQSSVDRVDPAGHDMSSCEGWPDISRLGERDRLPRAAETTLERVSEVGREGHPAQGHRRGYLITGSPG